MTGWAQALIAAFGGVIVAAISAWVTLATTKKSAARSADAAVQQAINDGFTKLTSQYDAVNTRLNQKISDLEGVVRDLTQHVESLERVLRDNGIPVPVRAPSAPHPYAGDLHVIEGGQVKPTGWGGS